MTTAMEIANGEGITLAAAAALLPGRNGLGTHTNTVLRWIYKGAKARDGRLIRLEACRVGSCWTTTKPAIARFLAALSEPPAPPAPARMARRLADVDAALDAAGI